MNSILHIIGMILLWSVIGASILAFSTFLIIGIIGMVKVWGCWYSDLQDWLEEKKSRNVSE